MLATLWFPQGGWPSCAVGRIPQLRRKLRHSTNSNVMTLTKRELKITVGLQDGEVIVLGGLAEDKTSSSTRSGPSFLRSFIHPRGHEESGTEILLVLQS